MWDGTTVQTGQPTPTGLREVRTVVRIEFPGVFGVCQDIRPSHGPANLHSLMGKSRATFADPSGGLFPKVARLESLSLTKLNCADSCSEMSVLLSGWKVGFVL